MAADIFSEMRGQWSVGLEAHLIVKSGRLWSRMKNIWENSDCRKPVWKRKMAW